MIPENVFNDTTIWHDDNPHRSLIVVDNFYRHPDAVRELALRQDYVEDLRYYKGLRTREQFLFPRVRETFQDLLQSNITDWTDQSFNGVFQQTNCNDPLVYHSDLQSYAAAIYLNPAYHLEGGTSFWAHTLTGQMDSRTDDPDNTIFTAESVLDSKQWRLVDKVAPVYNRLVIWDAKRIHSASSYQASTKYDPRLVQLFFFNTFDTKS
jgi:hypothetical protein